MVWQWLLRCSMGKWRRVNKRNLTGHHYQQYADDLKFQPLITWSRITTGTPAFRYKPFGYLSDMAGFCLYSKGSDLEIVLAFCNSVVANHYLKVLSPTLNIMTGQVLALPYNCNLANQKNNCFSSKFLYWCCKVWLGLLRDLLGLHSPPAGAECIHSSGSVWGVGNRVQWPLPAAQGQRGRA